MFIQVLIAITIIYGKILNDVMMFFLNGELEEEINIEQLKGTIVPC